MSADSRDPSGQIEPRPHAAPSGTRQGSRQEPSRYFSHLIIDDFLDRELHGRLLSHALESRERFIPTEIGNARYGGAGVDVGFRKSWACQDGLGQLAAPVEEAIKARRDQILRGLGLAALKISRFEIELVAHRDGSFFDKHIDAVTQSHRDRQKSDRVVTLVYYFHALPKQFSGGELALAPIGPGEPLLIEPVNNRLVAFASIAPHEVLPVSCPGDEFANARFAINVWLHRSKQSANATIAPPGN